MTLRRISCFGSLVVIFGCSAGDDSPNDRTSTDVSESSGARAHLDALRARLGSHEAEGANAVAPLLRENAGVRYRMSAGRLVPSFAELEEPESARVELPARANEPFSVTSKSAGLRVLARLRGARAVAAEIADGLVVYPGAAPEGGTLLQRATAEGTEDYLTLERTPSGGKVAYDVTLSSDVEGLRLVENTLEFLDGGGAPRLRVEAPYLVDREGREHAARLDVAGCAVDRSAAAPWGRAPVRAGAETCEVSISWDDVHVAYPALLDPAWTSTANLASARARHTAVVLNTGRVLVAGGTNATGSVALRSAEVYDPATRTWAATGNLIQARTQHTATLRQSGAVAVVGGSNLAGVHRNAESYSPTTGTWTALPVPLLARRQHTATLLQNGDILVTGGRSTSGSAALASAETLSLGNVWTATAAPLLAAEAAHTATLLGDGRVLLVGPNAPAAQLYVPSTRSFGATAAGADPREGHVALLLANGGVLVAGGASGVKSSQRYDVATNTWSRFLGSTNYDHAEASLHALPNGRALVVGGVGTTARSSTETFNPTWGTWAPPAADARMLVPRRAHAAVRLNDQKILVTGGIPTGSSSATAHVEVFDPATLPSSVTAEYQLPPLRDPVVNPDHDVELWAALYRPSTLVAGRRYPLAVFLHGNHATCGRGANPRIDDDSSYSTTGTCPPGYVVVPNHRGYAYIAEELAARGFFVVSINTNRGINGIIRPETHPDRDLILARGRMVLRHLEKLSLWDRGLEATPASLGVNLQNRIDFDQLALLGHSRGGEGVRVAYNEYREAGSPWPGRIGAATVRGIFEIGPVDGGVPNATFDATGTRWNVVLPGCDWDLPELPGVKVFDRAFQNAEGTPSFKSAYHVWGASHNFYNTEWQQVDGHISGGCINHSPIYAANEFGSGLQRQTGLFSALSFFTANVGTSPDAGANQLFDTLFPASFGYRVHRAYHPGSADPTSKRLEDFVNPTGTGSFGFLNETSGSISVTHTIVNLHDPSLRAGFIEWQNPSPSTYFQTNFAAAGSGLNLSSYQNLDFRVDRTGFEEAPASSFLVQLVNANGSLSASVQAADFVSLVVPPRGQQVLQTARIPLSRFTGANLASVRGVRFVFSTSAQSPVHLANVRATRTTTSTTLLSLGEAPAITTADPASLASPPAAGRALQAGPAATPFAAFSPGRITGGNRIVAIKSRGANAVEIALSATSYFAPRAHRLELAVGAERTSDAEQPGGNLYAIRFVLERAAWDRLQSGAPLVVRYGDRSSVEWDFGKLDKTRLDR
jgi:hypothetical protein